MGKIYKSAADLIGNTPLVEVGHIEEKFGLKARVLVKLEYFNATGSVKDRVAKAMIEDAEEKGILKPGATIIEPTSGNTGIGLAAIATAKGYRTIIVLPETMSVERRNIIKAYGAEIVLTPGYKGMTGAIAKAEELKNEIEGSMIAGQFVNPANPDAHRRTTGPEIWNDTDGEVDAFVAGVGTGGTISGIGKRLKEKNPAIQIVAVEPFRSQVLSGKSAGAHVIQGIGANFVPGNFNRDVVDVIYPVGDIDAVETARKLATDEGILCGISSGAAMFAALEFSKMRDNDGKLIVTILPDSGERYLSSVLYD